MIDVAKEKLLNLPQATALFPDRPSVATLWRWRTKGVHGRTLESVRIGGKIYTSVEAIQRFAQQHGGDSAEPPGRTPAARERAIAKADQELTKAGV